MTIACCSMVVFDHHCSGSTVSDVSLANIPLMFVHTSKTVSLVLPLILVVDFFAFIVITSCQNQSQLLF